MLVNAGQRLKGIMSFILDIFYLLGICLKVILEDIVSWILPTRYKSVENEITLITGAGSGLGRLMAIEFAKRKAKLILWDINTEANKETERLVREYTDHVYSDTCDVSDDESIMLAAKRARENVGQVQILINNAGIANSEQLLSLTKKKIKKTFEVNTLSHFWTWQEFLPSMLEDNHGHIVTISSCLGLFTTCSLPDYTASKHALVGFHQSLYFSLQRMDNCKISTTLVCPYMTNTGMFTGVEPKYSWLFPILDPQVCVDAIMHGILTNKEFIGVPRSMYLIYTMTTLLPMRLQVSTHKMFGVYKAFSNFKTRIYEGLEEKMKSATDMSSAPK